MSNVLDQIQNIVKLAQSAHDLRETEYELIVCCGGGAILQMDDDRLLLLDLE